jgi:uncharacterized protein YgiM (DUF1202 family)
MNIFDKAKELVNDAKEKIEETASPVTAALTKAGITTVTPSAQTGAISLTGTATSSQEAQNAVDIAKAVTGVTSVTSAITVNGIAEVGAGAKLKVDTVSSNLNIRDEPSMNGNITGKAAHNEIVTLVSKDSAQWWRIRTDDGEEGYASSEYLTNV